MAGRGEPGEDNNVYAFKFLLRDDQITHVSEYANPVTFAKMAGMPVG